MNQLAGGIPQDRVRSRILSDLTKDLRIAQQAAASGTFIPNPRFIFSTLFKKWSFVRWDKYLQILLALLFFFFSFFSCLGISRPICIQFFKLCLEKEKS